MTSKSPDRLRRRTASPARRWAWTLPLLSLAACSPAGLLTSLDRLSSSGEARRAASGIAFGSDPRQKLDVWVPRSPSAKPRPVVVFLYGGGWVDGARGDYGFAGAAFASQGFVTIVPDYRLVPQVRFPAFVEDGALAVKWARDHAAEYGGDPGRITLAGHSAGGYNAAMLALDPHFLRDVGVDPKIIRAAALLAAPLDFYPFTEARGRDALGQWPRPAETQPINFASASAPPIFLAAGTADTIVQPRNSKAMAARLRALGVPVELKLYAGKGHVDLAKALSKPFRGTAPVLADSAAFLRAHSAARSENRNRTAPGSTRSR
jgi:acetyl esterase/lipase